MLFTALIYLPSVLGILAIALATLFRRSAYGMLYFSAFAFAVALWLLMQFITQLQFHGLDPLFLLRITSVVSSFIAYFFLLFIYEYIESGTLSNRKRILLLIPPVIFGVLNFTTLGINQVEVSTAGIAVKEAGIAYILQLLVLVGYFLFAIFLLAKDTFKKSRTLRTRNYILLFALSQGIFFSFLASSVLAAIPSSQVLIPISLFIMVFLISFAIVRHRLFDIKSVVSRSVAYLLSIFTVSVIFSLVGFNLFENILFPNNNISTFERLLFTFLAVVLVFTFQPLKRFFDRLTVRIFYRDRYDTQLVLNHINTVLTSEIELESVISKTLHIIGDALKLTQASFIVIDGKEIYKTASYGVRVVNNGLNAKQLMGLHKSIYVVDELRNGNTKDLLSQYDVAIALRLRTKDGTVGYILLGAKQSGGIYTSQDIKLLEILVDELAIAVQNARSFEKIADFNITLQERIEEATKRLAAQNKKLKELDQAKDEFVSMASHQLRTPLTTIKGYLSMLQDGDAGKLNKQQANFADLASTSAQRMVFLISDMLNVSRINTGKLVIEKSPVDLEAIVKDEITQLERTAESRNVKLQLHKVEQRIPKLYLDEGKMRQVIMNFVDNAVYYAPNTTVEIFLEKIGDRVQFRVVDHGIGVPESEKNHLFTKFFRADNAKQTRPDGTGLGLFMAKMVVELQGGQVVFESHEGKGSTFGFTFPEKLPKVNAKIKPKNMPVVGRA